MNKRKTISFVMAVLMVLSLCSCDETAVQSGEASGTQVTADGTQVTTDGNEFMEVPDDEVAQADENQDDSQNSDAQAQSEEEKDDIGDDNIVEEKFDNDNTFASTEAKGSEVTVETGVETIVEEEEENPESPTKEKSEKNSIVRFVPVIKTYGGSGDAYEVGLDETWDTVNPNDWVITHYIPIPDVIFTGVDEASSLEKAQADVLTKAYEDLSSDTPTWEVLPVEQTISDMGLDAKKTDYAVRNLFDVQVTEGYLEYINTEEGLILDLVIKDAKQGDNPLIFVCWEDGEWHALAKEDIQMVLDGEIIIRIKESLGTVCVMLPKK